MPIKISDVKQGEWRFSLPYAIFLVAAAVVGGLLTLWLFWMLGKISVKFVAESFVDELSIYIPLNKGFLKALTYLFFILIIPISYMLFNRKSRIRNMGIYFASAFLIIYNSIIGIAMYNFKIDPITGQPTKCYVIVGGEVKYFDLVDGNERQFDPVSGKPCHPVTPELAGKLDQYESNRQPKRIAVEANPDMFDRALGSPLVWYYEAPDGTLELFDNEGFHPLNGLPLKPVTPNVGERWQIQRQRIIRGREEEQRAEEARQRYLARIEQERTEKEKQDRREQERIEKERVIAERAEREKEIAAVVEIGNNCDRLAGNEFDRNRNSQFAPVPYQLLSATSNTAVDACEKASAADSSNPRYKYQLARALQTRRDGRAKVLLQQLTVSNYPAAFDNLGWLLANDRQVRPAVALFRRGAELGNAEAMVSYATFLEQGKWIPQDLNQAFRWYAMAARLGHPDAIEKMRQYEERKRINDLALPIMKGIFEGIINSK